MFMKNFPWICLEEREAIAKSRAINYYFKAASADENSSQELLSELSQLRKQARKEAKDLKAKNGAISRTKHYNDIMASNGAATSKEFANLIRLSRTNGANKASKIHYEENSYYGEHINIGLEKYFINILAKARTDDSFDDMNLVITELQLKLINTIIFHSNNSHIPFTPEEVSKVLSKMKNGKGMDTNYHISEQYKDRGMVMYKIMADFWNQCYELRTIPFLVKKVPSLFHTQT